MKKFTRGFTLIELLVVIAIIGILASIVLVSLNGARKKGSDARVISDVQEIRTALETGYNGSGYPDINGGTANCNVPANSNSAATFTNCELTSGPDNTNLTTLNGDAFNQGGHVFISVAAGNAAYAIRGQLVSNASQYFCIDSTGATNPTDVGTNATVARCQ